MDVQTVDYDTGVYVEAPEYEETSVSWNGRDVKKSASSLMGLAKRHLTPEYSAEAVNNAGRTSMSVSEDKQGNRRASAEIEVRSDDNTCSANARSDVYQGADGNVGGKASGSVTVTNDNDWSVTVSGSVEKDTNGKDNAEVTVTVTKGF